jgi:hypothetical protein
MQAQTRQEQQITVAEQEQLDAVRAASYFSYLEQMLTVQSVEMTDERKKSLQEAANHLGRQGDISFENLRDEQKDSLLISIMAVVSSTASAEQQTGSMRHAVDAWLLSVRGTDAAAYARATVPGLKEKASENGVAQASQSTIWATDSDLKTALAGVMHKGSIRVPGVYVTEPIALSELTGKLEALQADLRQIEGLGNARTIVHFPVNAGGAHWVHGTAEFEGNQLNAVKLNDSMSSEALPSHLAQLIHTVFPNAGSIVNLKGIQQNGYSCGDYTVKSIMQEVAPQHSICKAEGAQALRVEMVNAIVENQGAQVAAAATPAVPASAALGVADQAAAKAAEMAKLMQEQKDALLARELAKVYEKNPRVSDGEAFKQATQVAQEKYSTLPFGNQMMGDSQKPAQQDPGQKPLS